MTTFSLCMIVKNEEAVLRRCLDSLKGLMDEIIIVDTGSTDKTKEIATEYTDQIYDFEWIDDFSAARNFAFSKAHMDYIYTADADEVVDETNQKRLAALKAAMLPEIEIVQMHYLTGEEFNTTQNFSDEYRPKLYKRLRNFTWIHPVHEVVRLDPVVFDSDVEILHLPQSLHSSRDFSIFRKTFERDGRLPAELFSMYAKELFISGSDADFADAIEIAKTVFEQKNDLLPDGARSESAQEAACILTHAYRVSGNQEAFFSLAFKAFRNFPCSEICCEIAAYFETLDDKKEAACWYQVAMEETSPVIDIRTGSQLPQAAISRLNSSI